MAWQPTPPERHGPSDSNGLQGQGARDESPRSDRLRRTGGTWSAEDGESVSGLPFGVWLDVPVRLHTTLVLLVALVGWGAFQQGSFGLALALTVYLVSLALHEAAHTLAAWRVAGEVDRVTLLPVGGLHSHRLPEEPEAWVFVSMAGPVAHLGLTLISAMGLALVGIDLLPMVEHGATLPLSSLLEQINTLVDREDPLVALCTLGFTINALLLVVNLLPAAPFDGGEAIRSLLWPLIGRTSAVQWVYRLALCTSLLLVTTATFWTPADSPWILTRIFLLLAGTLLLVGAFYDLRREEQRVRKRPPHAYQGTIAPQFGSDWTDGDDSTRVLVEVHRSERSEFEAELDLSDLSPALDEATEDQEVDDVLAKLHLFGMEHLSRHERHLLQRASQRYQRRRHQKD